MRIVAIIQARMGSTRLPGKVLKDVAGEPMLSRVVNRVRRATRLNEVLVATSTEPGDNPVVQHCAAIQVPVFRGSELDVLDRYYRAAQSCAAETVVRITSDCPLIDPGIVDQVIAAFMESKADYASNCLKRTYPRGLDVEVAGLPAIARAWREASEDCQRVHVMPYLYQSSLFSLTSVENDSDYGQNRWTVDTAEDLEFVRAVYSRLGPGDGFGWREVLRLLEREPWLAEINRSIAQKELHEA